MYSNAKGVYVKEIGYFCQVEKSVSAYSIQLWFMQTLSLHPIRQMIELHFGLDRSPSAFHLILPFHSKCKRFDSYQYQWKLTAISSARGPIRNWFSPESQKAHPEHEFGSFVFGSGLRYGSRLRALMIAELRWDELRSFRRLKDFLACLCTHVFQFVSQFLFNICFLYFFSASSSRSIIRSSSGGLAYLKNSKRNHVILQRFAIVLWFTVIQSPIPLCACVFFVVFFSAELLSIYNKPTTWKWIAHHKSRASVFCVCETLRNSQ